MFVGLSELKDGASGAQLYAAFLRVIEDTGILLEQIVSVATDGDPSMVGHQKGFIACLRKKMPSVLHVHCVAHNFQLALKDAFDNESHPISHELIKNTILLIHSITKSHQKRKSFERELMQREIPVRRLSRPIKVRWSTVGKSISETLQYLPIILLVQKDETDTKTAALRAFFRLPENLLHLSALNLILNQTSPTSQILQSNSLTILLAKKAVSELESRLASISTTEISNKLQEDMHILHVEEYLPLLDSAILHCQHMIEDLRNCLKLRFTIPNDTADFEFVSHDILMLPNTPQTDLPISILAQRFHRFIPRLLQQFVVTQWRHLKALYQIHFSSEVRTRPQIIDIVLTNQLFQSCSSVLPLFRVVKTISVTSVDTEKTSNLYSQSPPHSQSCQTK
ncbi:hypothetical protein BLNAU_25131 [Blattamonas nauphoetae]|uniref:DUF4371 domain-containing protein n=1 Tax=Blattamonas nauphoetae TaxID=2049346 RepID=A0ABQ9WKG4_9EUKA|nr:hypothetical protein BLNAU_25131 [Blattamonas nauphoetae]